MQIDNLDRKILSIITRDARVPYVEVGKACGVSGAAIHQRVQRLKKRGIIKGSKFVVDPARISLSTCAFIGVFLDHPRLYADVVKRLDEVAEITECHYTTGNYSLFIKVYAKDNDHLRTLLKDKIQTIEGVIRTETLISLEESINREIPILP